mgnify:CR=1 FL=1
MKLSYSLHTKITVESVCITMKKTGGCSNERIHKKFVQSELRMEVLSIQEGEKRWKKRRMLRK